ncbi:MAG: recombination mediator RecR [Victivallales bacterium]|jgi:recombination protein RecR|nr:recombination mediator RecR [Victivallales bacterium]
MTQYPETVESLIAMLKLLPGIGRRGAERLVLSLLEWEPEKLAFLGELIGTLPETVSTCPECGALANAGELCTICRQERRDASLVCVVETTAQLFAIEASGNFRGRYHVLGGRISPMDAENGSGLNLPRLLERARSGTVREIILALSSDVEGRATAIYLADLLRDTPVRVTQPALGLPAGANLSYADGATITAALTGRTEIK